MSENSSDSDSSCGWTVISHEGSDIEIVNSAAASDSCELTLEHSSLEQEELQVLHAGHGGGESSVNSTSAVGETMLSSVEETTPVIEVEEVISPEDHVYFGTTSDDSDIVTLEPPKLEEMGNQEVIKEAPGSDDFNMGSSSSSQYTFCPPEPVFSSQPSDEESSSDDTSHEPSPAPRRRRNRKKTISVSESEELPLAEAEDELSKEPRKRHFSGGLNKCVILALVIAVSMGFGHFYGKHEENKEKGLKSFLTKSQDLDINFNVNTDCTKISQCMILEYFVESTV